jgi:hypothetical protein
VPGRVDPPSAAAHDRRTPPDPPPPNHPATQAGLQEDAKRLEEMAARHRGAEDALRVRHARERGKLARKWREVDTEEKQEQSDRLRDLRSKHATDMEELLAGQVSGGAGGGAEGRDAAGRGCGSRAGG